MLPEAPASTYTALCGACRHPVDDHGMRASGELRGWITCAGCDLGDGDGACGTKAVTQWRSF